jgi:hypothetical protein
VNDIEPTIALPMTDSIHSARDAGMVGYIEDSYRSISIREAIGVCHGELAILVEKPHANWRRAAGG